MRIGGGKPPVPPSPEGVGGTQEAAKPATTQAPAAGAPVGQRPDAGRPDDFKAASAAQKSSVPSLSMGGPGAMDMDRKVSELGFTPIQMAKLSQAAKNLTVGDLNDLATKLKGGEVNNPALAALSVKDLNGLEEVFRDQRDQVAGQLDMKGGNVQAAAGDVNVSCCCCTPCCCCAAAEVNPFDE